MHNPIVILAKIDKIVPDVRKIAFQRDAKDYPQIVKLVREVGWLSAFAPEREQLFISFVNESSVCHSFLRAAVCVLFVNESSVCHSLVRAAVCVSFISESSSVCQRGLGSSVLNKYYGLRLRVAVPGLHVFTANNDSCPSVVAYRL